MKATQLPRSILVPVLDGDISEAALARGRSMLAASDARLVLLHIERKPEPGNESTQERSHLDDAHPLRWRQLAKAAHPGRVFVEVLEGDPARIIPVEAERFHSDAILLDRSLEAPAFPVTARTTSLSPPPQEAQC
ncbi:MAG: universal stress protein [bacterium]